MFNFKTRRKSYLVFIVPTCESVKGFFAFVTLLFCFLLQLYKSISFAQVHESLAYGQVIWAACPITFCFNLKSVVVHFTICVVSHGNMVCRVEFMSAL